MNVRYTFIEFYVSQADSHHAYMDFSFSIEIIIRPSLNLCSQLVQGVSLATFRPHLH